MPRLLLPVVLTSSLLAQGGPIYIVDAASGPGTNYTDIQTAVLAVPDGSTLLVRPGTYAPVVIDGKGIAILADPSFAITTPLTIGFCLTVQYTQVHQRVLVRGFVNGGSTGGFFRVAYAAGPVTVDAVNQTVSSSIGTPITITASPQVDIRNLNITGSANAPACRITNSSVVFEGLG